MPRRRLHANHAARQAAYKARQKEKDLQAEAPPLLSTPSVSCPSPTCPLQLSADASPARSGALHACGVVPESTLFQLHEERALRLAVSDLLFAAQRCGLLDKGDEDEPPQKRLYRWARELWKQKPKP